MLTVNDNNRVFINEIVTLFINDHEFQQRVIEELRRDDLCSDMQIGNITDISCAQNVRAIRICRVRHEVNDYVYCTDYWLCRFDGLYIVAECAEDKHHCTCSRVVNLSLLWQLALAA